MKVALFIKSVKEKYFTNQAFVKLITMSDQVVDLAS